MSLKYLVRTPLNSIINYLEIILDSGRIDEITREQLGKSLSSSKSLIYAINDLLDLTRVVSNDPVLMNETFDFKAEMKNVVDVFREETSRKGLQLSANLGSDIIPTLVKGDPMRLRQAISNILSNAVEHTTRGMIIFGIDVLESNDLRSLIEITVQDDGCGMSEEQLDSLFQHLEHIVEEPEPETALRSVEPSIGLGLAVVARFVRNCQGQIKIQSKFGTGTIVRLRMALLSAHSSGGKEFLGTHSDQEMADLLQNIEERASKISKEIVPVSETEVSEILTTGTDPSSSGSLPIASPTPSLSSQASVIGSAQASPRYERQGNRGYPFPSMKDLDVGLTKLRILVAEDNPLNSKILNLRLTKMGHHVTFTPDGRACADMFVARSNDFDVILMDLQVSIISSTIFALAKNILRCRCWMATGPQD